MLSFVLCLMLLAMPASAESFAKSAADPPWRIAVLGDSDSHSYHDRIWMPEGRGGVHAPRTLQWTEVLTALRGTELDSGAWGEWGTRKRLVQLLDWIGVSARAPRKLDYKYNFAFSGARCADLNEGVFRQVPRLLSEMDQSPQAWRSGVVLIRIGIVSIGGTLDAFALDPADARARASVRDCLNHIERAVHTLRQAHPSTRIVLVGILNNAHWPPLFERWQSGQEQANIDRGLDHFDQGLRRLASGNPRIAFFDDRAWFRQRWGERDANGVPAYRSVQLGNLRVDATLGDSPENAVLSDGHAGLIWNALWAQSLVDLLRSTFGTPVRRIDDDELVAFISRTLSSTPP